jgi:RNA polymerase sigma-70 factor, ECF subfamily
VKELTNPDIRRRAIFVAARIVGTDHAEDIFQASCVRVLQTANPWDGRSAFSTWFHCVVRNEALLYLRSARAKSRSANLTDCLDLHEAVCISPAESPEQAVITKQQNERIHRAVESLSPVNRDAIQAAYFNDPDTAKTKVAKKFGLSNVAFKSRLLRGRRELRNLLGGH